MKKRYFSLLISFICCAFMFSQAQGKLWVLYGKDTSNEKVISIKKNAYAPGYNADINNIPRFTEALNGSLPQKGDTVQIHFKFMSDTDIHEMKLALIDDSQEANHWMQVSTEWLSFNNIVRGKLYDFTLTFIVGTKPLKDLAMEVQNVDGKECKIYIR